MFGGKEPVSGLDTLYKFMILYMLDRAGQSMSKARISEFMLDKGYGDFFEMNIIINELIKNGFIKSQTNRNRLNLELTPYGQETLSMFPDRISPEIRREIDAFLKAKEYDLKNMASVQFNFYKGAADDYIAELTAIENKNELLSIRLSVPTEESARSVCSNWEKHSQEIYKLLMQKLL